MGNRVQNIRKAKFIAQQERCVCCCQPIWEDDGDRFGQFHNLSLPIARLLRSTAEHLVTRQECGRDSNQNIFAVCSYCKATRHRTPKPETPSDIAEKVRKRLVPDKSHGIMTMPIAERGLLPIADANLGDAVRR